MTANLPKIAAVLLGVTLSAIFIGMIQAWFWAGSRLVRGKHLLEPVDPIHSPWTWKTIGLVVATWVFIQSGVIGTYMAVDSGVATKTATQGKANPHKVAKDSPPRDKSDSAKASKLSSTEVMVLTTVSNVCLLLLIPGVLRTATRHPLKDLGIRWQKIGWNIRAGFVGFLLTTPLVYGVNFITTSLWKAFVGKPESHPLEQMVRADFTPTGMLLAFVSAVLLAPAAEELLFRGLIQGWLATRLGSNPTRNKPIEPLDEPLIIEPDLGDGEPPATWLDTTKIKVVTEPVPSKTSSPLRSRNAAIIFTSILFASVHLPQWPAPIAIFFLSLGLGWLYDRTGSLIAPFVMHAFFNALATLALFYTLLMPGPAQKTPKPPPACMDRVPFRIEAVQVSRP